MTVIPGNSVIREFENRIAEYCNSEFALSICNASTGILGVFYALGLSGEEIITTPLTWPGALSGPLALNCRIRFCDVEPVTLTMDPAKLETLISPDTRAVFSADVLGYPARLEEIKFICDKHDIWLIHDAASSFGSRIKGFFSGYHADVTILSFGAKKLFTTGEGGCIVTNSDAIYKTLLSSLAHPERQDFELGVVYPFSFNTRINPLAAEYGLRTFEHQIAQINRHQESVRLWIKHTGLRLLDDEIKPNYYKVLIAPEDQELLHEGAHELAKLPFSSVIYNEPAFVHYSGKSRNQCLVAEWAVEEYRVCTTIDSEMTGLDCGSDDSSLGSEQHPQ
jgi:dTDP-4-amino-4,6-dideoxygalactose transaminase